MSGRAPAPSLRDTVCPGRGPGCLVVAEVGQAHDGSLGTAHAFIDAAAHAGADAIKFQTHIAAAESTLAEPWRVPFSRQDDTRFAYWQRMELSEPQWRDLRAHAAEAGLAFLSTPFSPEAVTLLEGVGVAAWKVASGELGNEPLLDAIAVSGAPILLSTGMSGWDEIDQAVARLTRDGAQIAVLQCTSAYPCPPEQLGLNVLDQLRERYDVPVGLSDHTGQPAAALAAAALGAEVIEVHITLSPWAFGPDVSSSLTVEQLTDTVAGIRFLDRATANPVDKDDLAASMADLRATFSRSVVTRRSLDAGAVLAAGDLACKKPAGGFPPSRLPHLVGRALTRAVPADHPLTDDDLVPVEGAAPG